MNVRSMIHFISPHVIDSLQMWMNVRSMEPVQITPPVQTPLGLLYALAMKDS